MTLMEYEIFSTTNCTGYQSTDKVLEFRFRPNHSEQDYSEWETLKARYEKQTGAALPDNILVATLLNRTTPLQQHHLRLNVRTMDS